MPKRKPRSLYILKKDNPDGDDHNHDPIAGLEPGSVREEASHNKTDPINTLKRGRTPPPAPESSVVTMRKQVGETEVPSQDLSAATCKFPLTSHLKIEAIFTQSFIRKQETDVREQLVVREDFLLRVGDG